MNIQVHIDYFYCRIHETRKMGHSTVNTPVRESDLVTVSPTYNYHQRATYFVLLLT